MTIIMRILGASMTAATLLMASGAQAGSDSDHLVAGIVAGAAIGTFAATALPTPPSVYVYQAPPYWHSEPAHPYAYHANAWQEWQPVPDDEDSADDCDE